MNRTSAFVLFPALIGGFLLAVLTGDDELVWFAAVLGAALGYNLLLGSRIRTLERRVQDLEVRVRADARRSDSVTLSGGAAPRTGSERESADRPVAVQPRDDASASAGPSASGSVPETAASDPHLTGDPRARGDLSKTVGGAAGAGLPAWLSGALAGLRTTIARGNPVVQVGVVVLFFGVAFLVKYAAERDLVPVELRLAAVAVGGLAMLIVGWRLRTQAAVYATVLQGGGVGVLYLTVYAAAKLFGLVPPILAFVIMVALVAFSGVLAVLQNALSLALFGTVGGFLAPVLASTVGGSHLMLFTYYAVLNAGVLGIAWFRTWRWLNLTGFVFTFVIGSLWGYRYYRPEYFATTEPFLVLYFLFYVAVAVLYAQRQPLALRGYVDGGLVFGVPLVAFALQAALVKDISYGLAFSALALGGFYMLLATVLWRRGPPQLRLLTESFLALGVVFASLAIPLALDGRWTAAAWALEGAAIVWVGVRQARWQPRAFGVLLQFGAGLLFLEDAGGAVRALPLLNGIYLGSVMLALAGLFSAWHLQRNQDRLRPWEGLFEPALMAWGLLWWFASGLNEIDGRMTGRVEADASLTFVALSALALAWLSGRLSWPRLAWPPLGLVPVLGLAALGQFVGLGAAHPLGGWGLAAWPIALVASYRILWRLDAVWPAWAARYWHPMALWLLLFLLSWELDWLIQQAVQGAATWRFVVWALVPGFVLTTLWRFGTRIRWPVAAHFHAYSVIGLAPVALYLFAWVLAATLIPGSAKPLLYVPIINPLDLAQVFVLIALTRWCRWLDKAEECPRWWPAAPWWQGALAAGAFVWMNTAVARCVHFWGGVPYDLDWLYHSPVFQAAIAIVWTLTAFALMVLSRRRLSRVSWFIGAGLLAAVVAKLFLVDLVGVGTVMRIVSFLAVGLLMLVIGYLAPLPPRPPKPETLP